MAACDSTSLCAGTQHAQHLHASVRGGVGPVASGLSLSAMALGSMGPMGPSHQHQAVHGHGAHAAHAHLPVESLISTPTFDYDNDHQGGMNMMGINMNLSPGGPGKARIRRSENELRQAAECVVKGSTFQTVSDQFNIPISTIRFYMARRGILPQRRRGRCRTSPNNAIIPFHHMP